MQLKIIIIYLIFSRNSFAGKKEIIGISFIFTSYLLIIR